MSNKPDSNFYSINACVPADWTYIKAEWSDWAYKHAGTTSDWQIDNGRYAQRNGKTTTASYSNGWISDSGYKQIYRKSSLFWFEKDYTASITTSGIAVNPNPPTINVIPAKGDTGNVAFFYNSNNSGDGKITVEAKCNNKIVTIMDYNNSPNFENNGRKLYLLILIAYLEKVIELMMFITELKLKTYMVMNLHGLLGQVYIDTMVDLLFHNTQL